MYRRGSNGCNGAAGLFATILAVGKWVISKAGAAHSWWKRNQAPQFLKILITYFQVVEAGRE
jgi:hypothetical protein